MRKRVLGGMVLALGLGGLAAMGGLAHAADTVTAKPDDVIASRQAGFDLVQGVLSAMKDSVVSSESVKPLSDGAKGLVSWGQVIPLQFPAGTETGHKTKAKPDIWSDNAGFQKAAANFVAAAQKLQTLADADDKAGFAEQFKATGAACGACHRTFRAR
jgi:cytochrome c556